MNKSKPCCFCNREITLKNGCYVCKSCETICFSGKNKKPQEEILSYLQKIQLLIERDNERLHNLEQDFMSGKQINDESLDVLNTIKEFHSIKVDLEFLLKNNYTLSDKKTRQLLYKLLLLSEKFKNNFGGRYNG